MKTRLIALFACLLVIISAGLAVAQAEDRFKRFDKNNDGVLTPDELDRPKLFQRMDANRDGKVTFEEAKAAFEKIAQRARPGKDLPKPDQANVRYGPYERNVFDFRQAASDKPTPLVVFIHGGGFVGGDKSALSASALKRALDAGASVMAINYRFRKDAPIQDILRDAARSIQFVRANASKFNIDPKRIGCFGGSAGAGTSLWLAVHPDLADPNSDDPVLRESSRISACGCLNGQATYDLIEWEKVIYPFKPGWWGGPNEDIAFYHFRSRSDFETDAGKKILADCSMLGLLTSDDAPIFMSCSLPGGQPTDRGHILHHPKHVEVIKKKAQEVGVKFDSHLVGDKDDGKADPAVRAVEFLLKQMGVGL